MRRLVLRFSCALVLAVTGIVPLAVAAQSIQRCENALGQITYVNGSCPAGTRTARGVASEAAPNDADQKSAGERARKDRELLKQVEKQRAIEQAQAARQAQLAQARADKQAAQCRKLELAVRHARENLAAASPKQHAERQRKQQQAEQDFVLDCGPLPR